MEVEDLREAEPSRAQSSPAHFHIFGLLLPSTSPIYRFSPRLSSPTIYFVIPIYLPELPFSISFPCFGHLVMAANSPVQDPPTDASAKQSAPSPSPALVTPPLKIETPPSDSGQTPSAVPAPTPRPDDLPQPTSPDPIHLPSYSSKYCIHCNPGSYLFLDANSYSLVQDGSPGTAFTSARFASFRSFLIHGRPLKTLEFTSTFEILLSRILGNALPRRSPLLISERHSLPM